MSQRKKALLILSSVLKQKKNVCIIEKYILKASKPSNYLRICYQVLGDIIKKKSLRLIVRDLKLGRVDWVHPSYTNVINKIKEQNEFIENPFEIEEGVLTCKCGSKRVFSYTKQVRAADEPMTTFAQCLSCRKKWTDNA
jgi:DNA-directed RNA polymerase subunit M/transcription elongation factor TFIIS